VNEGNVRKAGSAEASAEPAREQVVIRDKRKIDMSGRPRIPTDDGRAADDKAGTAEADAAAAEGSAAEGSAGDARAAAATSQRATADPPRKGAPAAKPGAAPNMGQPGSPAAPAADRKAGAKGEPVKTGTQGATAATTTDAGTEATDSTSTPVPAALGAELEALRSDLDERLRDLQRVTAEYANYRKRVERDRTAMAEQAIGVVLQALLPILDDLDRARDHGDLTGPFGAVAEQLNAALAKFGLTVFGEQGDAFDPTRHEAVAHQTSAEVTEPTCVTVMRRGYMLGDRLLRPALVAVADPE
jgi:molecular chaperone GrpE